MSNPKQQPVSMLDKGHRDGCKCPPCRYLRGESQGELPRLSIRISPDLKHYIMNQPEGARRYIEKLVKQDQEMQKVPDKYKE